MAEPEEEPRDLAVQAAEVAADVAEAEQARERRRLVVAFSKAVSTGARAAGRGTRAARKGMGFGTAWLSSQVTVMAPKIRVRDQAALRAQFGDRPADEIADLLIDGAARASSAAGGAAGVWAALPLTLPAFPAEVAAETLVLVGIEIKLIAELHEAYGAPAQGNRAERTAAYIAAWAHRRGVFMIPGGVIVVAGCRWHGCFALRLAGAGSPWRIRARPAADRCRGRRLPQRQGDQEARPGHPPRPAPLRDQRSLTRSRADAVAPVLPRLDRPRLNRPRLGRPRLSRRCLGRPRLSRRYVSRSCLSRRCVG